MGASPQDLAATPRPVVCFLSDYGTSDEFVGVCHAVIARIAPDVRVIDLAHGVRGVRAGAAVLAQSVGYVPDSAVILAIVDPLVGTERRCIVVSTGRGSSLVGPDNGLLIDAAAVLDGAVAAHELSAAALGIDSVSATFHGRDLLAPAAARLALGAAPQAIGEPVDVASLVQLEAPFVAVSPGRVVADVVRSDAFGNVQLGAPGSAIAHAGLAGRVLVRCAAGVHGATVGRTFADAPHGGLVVLVDSAGLVAVAANGASAFERLGRPQRLIIEGF